LIAKKILQTSKDRQPKHVTRQLKNLCGTDWKYSHYTDAEVADYFQNNALDEFPLILKRFNQMPTGAHKADLFRYYYLFIEGGVFIDSDAMPLVPLDEISVGCDFFSVSSHHAADMIFQGFIGAKPGSQIIYEALMDAYTMDPEDLRNDYFRICRNLHAIIEAHKTEAKGRIRIFREDRFHKGAAKIMDDSNKIILLHYHDRTFPPRFPLVNMVRGAISAAVRTITHPRL